jgi:DNA-binding transcriptional ArsR family regulator
VKLIRIYQCFCDETRLRIINLLIRGPFCVCHIQQIVGESQVNVSRHLSYLKDRGMVEVRRHQNWMIYRLPEKGSRGGRRAGSARAKRMEDSVLQTSCLRK